MTTERLASLAGFLADFTGPTSDNQIENPIPWAGYVYVVQVLLDAVANLIGKQNSDTLVAAIQNELAKFPLLDRQFNEAWDKCDSDEELFAHLESILSQSDKS